MIVSLISRMSVLVEAWSIGNCPAVWLTDVGWRCNLPVSGANPILPSAICVLQFPDSTNNNLRASGLHVENGKLP